MFALSVCITVHNDAKYISACIDSIITQQRDDIEIIIVNDGSTDKSGNICEYYSHKFKNIRVIHQHNKGVSSARNTAMKSAKGKWITFVDGDDSLMAGAVDIMGSYFESSADVVSFSFTDEQNPDKIKAQYDVYTFKNNEIDDYIAENFHHRMWREYNFSHVCGKMFRRQLIAENNILFEMDVSMGEDTVFSFCCESRASEVIVDTRSVYCVTKNINSSTRHFSANIADNYNMFVYYAKNAIIANKKWNNDKIVSSFYCHIVYIIKMSLKLGAYHPDCKWGRRKRIAWLKSLCGYKWVGEVAMYDNYSNLISDENRVLLKLINNKSYSALDFKLYRLKIRARLLRALYSTRFGTYLLIHIKKLLKR